ncbi:hypothetical protein BN946_scf184962.g75 [Trametes cinnabarina]|uniref:Uncharacterized protein n=1 Tax=Pycnoporus cinnabarinus TaxID=5643 RepID=A0A060SC96_PYCCI|nr:hypothetical protein BN946_scf184962.g75 [Trametes cinnabarina]
MNAFTIAATVPIAHDASVSLDVPHNSYFDDTFAIDNAFDAWFDWDRWCADHGFADGHPNHHHDAPDASSHVTLNLDTAAAISVYDDAFRGASYAGSSDAKVPGIGALDIAPLDTAPLDLFDASLSYVDLWLHENSEPRGFPELLAPLASLPVVEPFLPYQPSTPSKPETEVELAVARPCKRKWQGPECDLWPTRSKKTRCSIDASVIPVIERASSSSSSITFSSAPSSPSSTTSTSPSSLTPVVVVPASGLRCPMLGCGISLPAKDSAWRGHFRTAHHKDVCHDARCAGDCKRACPLPRAGCTAGEKCAAMPMSVESIGRHLLNVHITLRHRCPVCGVEKAQRYSSCQRHINTCIKSNAPQAPEL